ncbi:MAG: ATP-binding protein, partial [Bacteroidota bacterium]
ANDVTVELVVSGLKQRLDLRIEMEIYRTIQELVTNAMKHSKCKELSIQLLRKEQEISILVEDDGIGFDVKSPNFKMGLGLRNIESRIEKMDGFIEFDAYPNRGTTANIKIPLKLENYDEDTVSG